MALRSSDTARDVTIQLRANRRQRAVIDQAAGSLGKSRSDFMLEAAVREAGIVLADQRVFILDDRNFRSFLATLSAPPKANPKLRRLMRTRPVWER